MLQYKKDLRRHILAAIDIFEYLAVEQEFWSF